MATILDAQSVSSLRLEPLSEVSAYDSSPRLAWDYYEIEDMRRSECALVLFTRHAFTSERVVMKILRGYKDFRYNLATLGKRQQCQLEALQRNRVFTPEVYIGLAPIIGDVDVQGGSIHIGECLKNPTQQMLDPETEYALLMYQLPRERRLDALQARTKSVEVADEIIESYLELTGQQDEGARWVLDYYLVEKALVGAAISVVYDQLPQLGCSLLEAAEMRLNCLVERGH